MAKKFWKNGLGKIIKFPNGKFMFDEECCCNQCVDFTDCLNCGDEVCYDGMNLELDGFEDGTMTKPSEECSNGSCTFSELNRAYSLDYDGSTFSLELGNCDGNGLFGYGLLVLTEQCPEDPNAPPCPVTTLKTYARQVTATVDCGGPGETLRLIQVSFELLQTAETPDGCTDTCQLCPPCDTLKGGSFNHITVGFDDFPQTASHGKCSSGGMVSTGPACKCGPNDGLCEDTVTVTGTASLF